MKVRALLLLMVIPAGCTGAQDDDSVAAPTSDGGSCGFAGSYNVTYTTTYGTCGDQAAGTLVISSAAGSFTVSVPGGATATPTPSFDSSICSASFGWTEPPSGSCSGTTTFSFSTGAFASNDFDGTLTLTGCSGTDAGADGPCTYHFSAVRQ